MGPWIIPENSDLRKVLCHRFDLLGDLIELQPRRPGDDGNENHGEIMGNFWKSQNFNVANPVFDEDIGKAVPNLSPLLLNRYQNPKIDGNKCA